MDPSEKYRFPHQPDAAAAPSDAVMPPSSPAASRSLRHAASEQHADGAQPPDDVPIPLKGTATAYENLGGDDLPAQLKRRYREEINPVRRWYRYILGGIGLLLLIPILLFGLGMIHSSPKVSQATLVTPTTLATALSVATTSPIAGASATTLPGTPTVSAANTAATSGGAHPAPTPSTTPLPTATPIVSNGLVGYWRFDEGNGTVAHDASGNNNAGNLQGGVSWGAGHTGSALNFDGTNGEVDTTHGILNVNGNYTVAAWVRLSSTSQIATAISQDGNNASAFYLQYITAGYDGVSNKFSFTVLPADMANASVLRATDPNVAAVNTWYYLTGVNDTAQHQIRLYVDGALVATAATSPAGWSAYGATVVGRGKYGVPTDFWPGTIDEVRLYNRVLSAQEIQELSGA